MHSKKSTILIKKISMPFICFLLFLIFTMVIVPFILNLATKENSIEIVDSHKKQNKISLPSHVDVYDASSSNTISLPLEEYVKGVVACEMPSTFHEEALKAQAVAARTYAVARTISSEKNNNPSAHTSAPLCNTTHCQVYKNHIELKKIHGSQWMNDDYVKISKAVDDTRGKLLYYNGQLVEQALFHSSSGGATENSEDVFSTALPYLVSVDSPYESKATHQNEKKEFSLYEFQEKIKNCYPNLSFGNIGANNIKIIKRSEGNRVSEILIGKEYLTGRQLREALDLSSANFTIEVAGDTVTIISNGSGHGVGMSQYGANGMAENGWTYKKILSHYYSGTEVF